MQPRQPSRWTPAKGRCRPRLNRDLRAWQTQERGHARFFFPARGSFEVRHFVISCQASNVIFVMSSGVETSLILNSLLSGQRFLDFAGLHSEWQLLKSTPLDLPVLHELIWDFLEKTRGPLENVAVPSAQAHLRISEIKLIARACDGHIKQTPFFLERVARIERAIAGKHPVG